MRLPSLLIFACSLSLAFAQESTVTALDALKLIPKKDAKKIARIEARDGALAPERWYLIVHDPADANGVHEFVVAGKEIAASRAISQFVESVKPDDVMRLEAIRIDSDRAAKLAKQYAAAN